MERFLRLLMNSKQSFLMVFLDLGLRQHQENSTWSQKAINNKKRWECVALGLLVTSCVSHLLMHRGNKNPAGDGGKEHPSGHFSLKLAVYAACTECETFLSHPITEPSLPSVSPKWFLKLLLVELCWGGTNFVALFLPLVYLCFRRKMSKNNWDESGFYMWLFWIFNILDLVKQKGQGTNAVYF